MRKRIGYNFTRWGEPSEPPTKKSRKSINDLAPRPEPVPLVEVKHVAAVEELVVEEIVAEVLSDLIEEQPATLQADERISQWRDDLPMMLNERFEITAGDRTYSGTLVEVGENALLLRDDASVLIPIPLEQIQHIHIILDIPLPPE